MLKLIIVDDEPRIRRGLKNCLPWDEMDIEVVGEAEDGQEAIELAKKVKPDIMFLDIYMPVKNGIETAREMFEIMPECMIIIISGFDEFEYAQQAIECGVFSYILKPVDKKKLRVTVENAVGAKREKQSMKEYSQWAENYIESNGEQLKKTTILSWLKGSVTSEDINNRKKIFSVDKEKKYSIFIINKLSVMKSKEESRQSMFMGFEEIAEKYVKELFGNDTILAEYEEDKCLGFFEYLENMDVANLLCEASQAIEYHCGYICVSDYVIVDDIYKIKSKFEELAEICDSKITLSPSLLMVKSYVDKNYADDELTLNEVAEKLFVSESYISRLYKKELGKTFNEYLTSLRIEKAKKYLLYPYSKVYEVAEKVGYKTQHYFSRVFKAGVGMTPLEYKSHNEGRKVT